VDFKGWRVNAAWAGLSGIPGHTCADLFRFPSVRLIRHISSSGVAKDEAAVRAAIALPWSNGRGPNHTAQNGKAPNVRSRQNRLEELRKKEINGSIRLPKRDFFTRGQKLKVKDPWHILSGYDVEFAGMSTRERVRVMLEWFGRRQTIALQINSVVGCLIAAILLMILSALGTCSQPTSTLGLFGE
jgi:hypothetical protein